MNSHLRKVASEARFKKSAIGCIEGLPGGTEYLMHNTGRLTGAGLRPSGFLLKLYFLLAGSAFAAEPVRCCSDGELGRGHAHYLVCDAIRLVLQRMVDLSNFKMRLYGAWEHSGTCDRGRPFSAVMRGSAHPVPIQSLAAGFSESGLKIGFYRRKQSRAIRREREACNPVRWSLPSHLPRLNDPSARKAVLELAESFDRLARAAATHTRLGAHPGRAIQPRHRR
jgi:hypothetical protein